MSLLSRKGNKRGLLRSRSKSFRERLEEAQSLSDVPPETNLAIDDLIVRASEVSDPKGNKNDSIDARVIQAKLDQEFGPGPVVDDVGDLGNAETSDRAEVHNPNAGAGEPENRDLGLEKPFEEGSLEAPLDEDLKGPEERESASEAGENPLSKDDRQSDGVGSGEGHEAAGSVSIPEGASPDRPDHVDQPKAAQQDKEIAAVSQVNSNVSTDVRNPSTSAALPQAPDLSAMVRKEVVAGSIAIGLFFLFLFGWSAVAPISSAAIAPGVISPHGSRKTVQHLEGGIIDQILVEEGSEVEAGDPLVLLQDTMARASYDLIQTQYYTFAARHAGLLALQSGIEDVYFPDWLAQEAGNPDVAAILATEVNLLEKRRGAHADRKAVLQKKIGQLEKEIEGVEAQIEGQTRQLALIGKEIKGVQTLVDKGLERMPRLLGLQRDEAQINALKGANIAMIAKTEQAIGATELELIAADAVLQDEVARELAQVQGDLSAAGERMAASGDILNRIEIKAPVAGKVIGLKYHTAGGVIAPGAAILDIVPKNEELIIEARVSPMDIDVVYETLQAQVRLSSFAQRNLPMIEGTVRHVSADRHLDEVTGEPYFLATVEINRGEVAKIGPDVTLTPGMPAEVMIVTGEKTLMGYLLQPAVETLRHSFREG
jgi:membrane fusion protein, type I secretion system